MQPSARRFDQDLKLEGSIFEIDPKNSLFPNIIPIIIQYRENHISNGLKKQEVKKIIHKHKHGDTVRERSIKI